MVLLIDCDYRRCFNSLLLVFILSCMIYQTHAQLCTTSDSMQKTIYAEEFTYTDFNNQFIANRVVMGSVRNRMYIFVHAQDNTKDYTHII